MTQQYHDAVDWLKGLFAPYAGNGRFTIGDHEPSEIVLRFALRIVWVECRSGGVYRYPSGALSYLTSRCEVDRGAFRLLADICASHVAVSEVIPDEAKAFAVLYLAGEIREPKRSTASKTFLRNLHLFAAADACTRHFGLSLTRNDAAASQISACDAVAEALSALGYHTSFRAVKELFFHESSAKLRLAAAELQNQIADIQRDFPEVVEGWQLSLGLPPSVTE